MRDWFERYVLFPIDVVNKIYTFITILGGIGFWALVNQHQPFMTPVQSGLYLLGTFILVCMGIIGVENVLAKKKKTLHETFLVVIPKIDSAFRWDKGAIGKIASMNLSGDFFFTNSSQDYACIIAKTYLVIYYLRWGIFPTSKRQDGIIPISPIEPQTTIEGRALWLISPPIREGKKPLRGRAVFIDQFGNECWTQRLTWHHE